MSFQVVHPNQRKAGSEGKAFRSVQADYQRPRQTGTTLVAVTHDRDILDRFDRVIDFKSFAPAEAP